MASKKRQQWDEHDMRQAIENVQDHSMGFKLAAKTFNVPKTTLQRRLAKQDSSKGNLGGRTAIFSKAIEEEIAGYIIDMETRFFGLTSKYLRRMVFEVAEKNKIEHRFNRETKMAGWKWVRGFLKRNPRISLRSPESTSLARAQAFNKPNIQAYFNTLSNTLEQYNFPPENIFNMDESGLTTVQKKCQKIYASKGRKQVGALSSAERGQHVIVVCAMNVMGTYIPPALIYPRQRMNDELMNDAPVGGIAFVQEKGWMTSEIFCRWLKHFVKYTKASNNNKVLLLLDGHSSHKSLESLQFAKENGVIVFCFPADCSHHVQPLDVGFFRPLHTYFDQEIQLRLRQNPGKAVTQFKIAGLLNQAYLKSAVPSNAINSFKKTGIHPFNPHVFEDWQFAPALAADKQIPEAQGDIIENQMELEIQTPSTSGLNMSSSSVLDISVKEICPPPQTVAIGTDKKNAEEGEKLVI
ncbi:uncharacterized protein LOC130903084 [Diorhabda carinulata]|uniref:uncharacterized protein LOC130903084 n=1 Tax=Diorhabda carinulata TaxID=1163345 RepID=UPI0025A134A3|nr:uncharacterized protein LOC130903084 [Diorhabda carinulata]